MQFIDIVTALTITGILGILVLYVTIVYKKGWLKRDLRESETYFLCPNTKCRRVFRDPVWLTDLSQTPPESYQACPHCSTNLQTSPYFVAKEEKPKPQNIPSTAPPITDIKKPSERPLDFQKESIPRRPEIIREVQSPTLQSSASPKPEKPPTPVFKASAPIPEIRKETPPKQPEPSKKLDEKKVGERPRACPHHFGYVKTLPKNTSIPDECLWCPWIVECLTGAKEVEA